MRVTYWSLFHLNWFVRQMNRFVRRMNWSGEQLDHRARQAKKFSIK